MRRPLPQIDVTLAKLRGCVLACPHRPNPKRDLVVFDSDGAVAPFVVARKTLAQHGGDDRIIRWVLSEVERQQASDPALANALPVAIVAGDTTALLFVSSKFEMLSKGGVS
jgi:hypothetical protein